MDTKYMCRRNGSIGVNGYEKFISLQMDADKADATALPALETEMLLEENAIIWSPPLGTEAGGVGSTLLESIDYISKIGTAVQRFDTEEGALRHTLSSTSNYVGATDAWQAAELLGVFKLRDTLRYPKP